jgi:hypothetical protein
MEMISWLPENMYDAVFGSEAFQRPYPQRASGEEVENDVFAAFRAPDGSVR